MYKKYLLKYSTIDPVVEAECYHEKYFNCIDDIKIFISENNNININDIYELKEVVI